MANIKHIRHWFEFIPLRFEFISLRFEFIPLRFEFIPLRFEFIPLRFEFIRLRFEPILLIFKNDNLSRQEKMSNIYNDPICKDLLPSRQYNRLVPA
jgi:hypothetical protein